MSDLVAFEGPYFDHPVWDSPKGSKIWAVRTSVMRSFMKTDKNWANIPCKLFVSKVESNEWIAIVKDCYGTYLGVDFISQSEALVRLTKWVKRYRCSLVKWAVDDEDFETGMITPRSKPPIHTPKEMDSDISIEWGTESPSNSSETTICTKSSLF